MTGQSVFVLAEQSVTATRCCHPVPALCLNGLGGLGQNVISFARGQVKILSRRPTQTQTLPRPTLPCAVQTSYTVTRVCHVQTKYPVNVRNVLTRCGPQNRMSFFKDLSKLHEKASNIAAKGVSGAIAEVQGPSMLPLVLLGLLSEPLIPHPSPLIGVLHKNRRSIVLCAQFNPDWITRPP